MLGYVTSIVEMPNRLLIDDLIVLGQSSPDTMKDGRPSVCTAGYSPAHGFIRIYPTRIDSPLRLWNIVSVPVERNPQDIRVESWKIQGSKSEWDSLSEKIVVRGSLASEKKLPLLSNLVSGCVFDIRDQGRSLGIVKPASRKCYLSERHDFDPYDQTTLDGGVLLKDKNHYPFQPRAEFFCSQCRSDAGHDQQILEWGVYEWMRKNPGKEECVWENLFAHESSQEILFFVGNQARHPSSFMVIDILRIKRLTSSEVPYREPALTEF